MIDWLDDDCTVWGACSRWILNGPPDHEEGWATKDTIERAREGLLDSKQRGPLTQHFGEVRVGRALSVHNGMRVDPMMPELLQATLWVQYVVKVKTTVKVAALNRYFRSNISVPEFWRNIDRAHHFLSARVMPISPTAKMLRQ